MTYSFNDWQAGKPIPKEGWDAADAIQDGWSKQDLDNFMRGTVKPWPFPGKREAARAVENKPAPSEPSAPVAEREAAPVAEMLDPEEVKLMGSCANGVTLGDFYAYMPSHSYIFSPSGELWPAVSVNARISPIPILDDHGNQKQDEKGKPLSLPAAAWLDRNRPVEQMTWAPGEPQLVRDRLTSDGGWIKRFGCACFNLYRPPLLKSGDATKAEFWTDHIRRVYPADADHIIKWLAHRAQKPHEKINHALVLGGAPGIGKDTLLEPVKAAVGPWNFAEVSPQHMLGRFNGFVKSVILRVSEARDLGDVDRFAFYDHMKTYTAAPPDVLRVDEKHLREYSVFNVCGVIITTNYRSDGIYLPAEDRRHFVAWSDAQREDFAPDYWAGLYSWYENGGVGHAAAYLRELDITDFNPKAPPEKTPAFWAIADANRAPEDAELADAIDALGNPNAITLRMVLGRAEGAFADWLQDRKNRRKIPHRLEAASYIPVRNPDAADGLWKIGSKRQAVYARKTLSMRDQIIAARDLVIGQCGW